MAITRRIVAHDENEDNQWLKVDHSSRFIENDSEDWQFLFGPNSTLTASTLVPKISARINTDTFGNIQVTGYLYDAKNASISNAAACSFRIFKVSAPDWTDVLVTTLAGTQLSNNYYYINPTIASLGIDFEGGDTIMVEATITRLSETYRDRVYINHLGIYDSVVRLRQDVEWLDISKLDE